MRSLLLPALCLVSSVLAYSQIKMLCLVNQERTSRGLSALGMDSRLNHAAQLHSDDQASMDYSGHDGSNGSTPSKRISRAGYNWMACGENVAYGYPTEKQCMRKWMNSSGITFLLTFRTPGQHSG